MDMLHGSINTQKFPFFAYINFTDLCNVLQHFIPDFVYYFTVLGAI